MHSAKVTADGSLHTAADVPIRLFPIVIVTAQPGTHLLFGSTVIVDLQIMRVDDGKPSQLGNYSLGHLLVETCCPDPSQRWNKTGFTPSKFGVAGEKKDKIWLNRHRQSYCKFAGKENSSQESHMKAGRRLKKPESYRMRTYRQFPDQGELVAIQVQIQETDLQILATKIATFDVKERATELVLQYRLQLENYIVKHPQFLATLDPLPIDFMAPPLVREMLAAGLKAGVGPMAAVAGVLSEFVGKALVAEGVQEIIVENGGDIYVQRLKECSVAIFAGQSPLSYKVGLRLLPSLMPIGVCTSSGTVGHSLSFGKADSVTVVARSTALADAVATRLGNEVGATLSAKAGVERALAKAKEIEGIEGAVVICGEVLGAMGAVELVQLAS